MQHEFEWFEVEHYTGKVLLECNLRYEHGWPFVYHAYEALIDMRLTQEPFDAIASDPLYHSRRSLLLRRGAGRFGG